MRQKAKVQYQEHVFWGGSQWIPIQSWAESDSDSAELQCKAGRRTRQVSPQKIKIKSKLNFQMNVPRRML